MKYKVAVIVLGDLGHSPRMQNHCLSLAESGCQVDFIGYRGSAPHRNLMQNRKITLRYLSESPVFPTVIGLFLKFIWQCLTLLYCLTFTVEKPDLLLLQNPPGLPAMFCCWLYTRTIGRPCKLVIDWHNYTYSIFALRFTSPNHWFVKLVFHYEFFVGRHADGGLCVTDAMKQDLARKGIPVKTYYDAANSSFRPLDSNERLAFLRDISEVIEEFRWLLNGQESLARPAAMLVSSTSWTPDEDFDLLLTSLKFYDDASQNRPSLPRLLVVVTGKGPLKEFYLEKAKSCNFRNVALVTPWLTAEDYPKLLACADMGISLHFSSSGLDLPMKIVDMQACALPILSVDFACIKELVRDSTNGFVFSSAAKLHEQLVLLLDHHPDNHVLQAVRRTCADERRRRCDWHDSWDSNVRPYLHNLLTG